MNCPVCKKEIKFKIPEEEFYYDCLYCQSSLLFSQGECLVINAETQHSSQLDQETEKNNLTDNKNPQKTTADLLEKNAKQHASLSVSENSEQPEISSPVVEENDKQNEKSFDSKILKEQTEQAFSAQNESLSTENAEKNIETAEDFYPDEKTEVPELQSELENSKQSTAENLNEPSSVDFQNEKKEDFSDVLEFAKKQKENIKNVYLYDLILSEINSQNLKQQVLDILEDSYLNLEKETLHLQDIIEKGQIKIAKISPLQTYIIVNSLMGASLNIYWEQHHIADD